MSDQISHSQRLARIGVELPTVVAPLASYQPAVRAGDWVYTAGQLPIVEGELAIHGKLGADVTVEQGIEASRIAAFNAIAAAASVCGGVDNIAQVVKVTVFVASDSGFIEQQLIANGASSVIGDVFGDAGLHARSAVGVASLPLDAPVEVELICITLSDK